MHHSRGLLIGLLAGLAGVWLQGSRARVGDFLAVDEFFKTTAELARLRGYHAEDHFVETADGYIINVVRVTNPLINNGSSGLASKQVILFVHGTLESANSFLINSQGARPQDYSRHNAAQMGRAELERLLRHDKGRNCLALTALNFGHEIWLMNRRGGPQSMGRVDGSSGDQVFPLRESAEHQRRVESILANVSLQLDNSTRTRLPLFNPLQGLVDAAMDLVEAASGTINTDYWAFSMDEQAEYDLPAVVSHIRAASAGRRLSMVAHSAGGAIALMALANEPEFAANLDRVILWSPALDLGHTAMEQLKYAAVGPAFTPYIGPVPPPSTVAPIQATVGAVCANILARKTLCSLAFDLTTGIGGRHRNIQPGFFSAFLTPVSSREIAQLGQSSEFGRMHRFDYHDPKKNLIVYGAERPPAYEVARIRLADISFVVGAYDGLVSPADVRFLRARLRVPSELEVIQSGLFNHVSYFIDDNLLDLITIPSLERLERAGSR